MEVYFDPDVLKQVASEFQQDLLEGLTECRYSQVSSNGVLVNSENAKQNSSGSRGGVFVNSENAKQSWLREEEKIISISPNGNGRSHNDRLYAYYDRKTDRMYVFHYLTDHDTSNKDTMNKLIAEGPDAINYDIMEKINAHQAALDSGQKPEGLGFEDAKVHLNARQMANLARERLDLDEVFKDDSHLKKACTFLQGEFHNAKYEPADFEALKEMCMDPDGNFLPNTVKGKKTILQYAENDPEFKNFLEEMYVEYEKIHPLKTDAEIKAETNGDKLNGDKPNSDAEQPNRANQNGDKPKSRLGRPLSRNAWQNIDPNDPSKGIRKIVDNKELAQKLIGQYKQANIQCMYNKNTKSIEITDSESVRKLREFETKGSSASINTSGRKVNPLSGRGSKVKDTNTPGGKNTPEGKNIRKATRAIR